MTPTLTVTPAIVGDAVPMRLQVWDAPSRGCVSRPREHVLPRCDEPVGRGYFCLSCSTFLANVAQLEMHTETGVHVIAHSCDIHGAEAPQ